MSDVLNRGVQINTILSKLKGVKQVKPNSWQCLCPAHPDKEPSLSITEGADKVLMKCHSGCDYRDILGKVGLTERDLFFTNGNQPKVIEAVYPYVDEGGKVIFEVVRYKPKGFSQRRLENGKYIYNLNGIEPVIYRLPDVIMAIKDGQVTYIVEGEKDADTLTKLGLNATTGPMGAGKWKDRYSGYLSGADVVIIPDKDEPGRQHADQVARSLLGKASSIKIIDLPGEGKDVTDWIQAGGDRDKLIKAVEAAPNYVPLLTGADDDGSLFQITDLGPVKIFTQAKHGIQIKVRRIKEHEDGKVSAVIEIKTIEDKPVKLLIQQINLTGPEVLKKAANSLKAKRPAIDWGNWLEEIAAYVIESAQPKAEYREVWIDDKHEYAAPEYLVDPLVREGTINYIYGLGGSLKTYMAMILAICINLPWKDNPLGLTVPKSGRVLWLDWENGENPDYFPYRMDRLIKALKVFGPGNTPNLWFDYMRCRTSLADDIETILEYKEAKGSTVVIIDSLALAAGKDDLIKADSAVKFTQAAHLIGNTVLVLAHTQKSNEYEKSIYGSAFFENLGRNIWLARNDQSEGSNIADVTLKQRKANDAPTGTELAFRFAFNGRVLDSVQRIDPVSNGYCYGPTHSMGKITDAIRAGETTINSIAAYTGIKYDTVYKTLTRNADKVFLHEGESWALI